MVLILRRHEVALAGLSYDEAAALGPLISSVSRALAEVVGCVKTYVAQFAEDPRFPHVHVHVIPRFEDQPADQLGPRVFSQMGVSPDKSVTEERMNEIAIALRNWLGTSGD